MYRIPFLRIADTAAVLFFGFHEFFSQLSCYSIIIKWIQDGHLTKDDAAALLTDIMLHVPSDISAQFK